MSNNFLRQSQTPALLMCVPFGLSAEIANNIWMEEIPDEERRIDSSVALEQFSEVYSYLAKDAHVYLLPSVAGLQDQTFVSNLGVVLPHLDDETVVVSKFRSPPRKAEAPVGVRFFESMEFAVIQPPDGHPKASARGNIADNQDELFFEGEADLKFLTGNTYFGGFGIRTSRSALDWIAREFDANVIPVEMNDLRLFHLDCLIFPVSSEVVVACTPLLAKDTLAVIEQHAEVIPISVEEAHCSATNVLRLHKRIIYASDIDVLPIGHEAYEEESTLVHCIDRICKRLSMEPVRFDLSEFYKSGGGLACMIMHLNYANRL